MAIERSILTLPFKAAEDLSGNQFHFVTQLGADDGSVQLMNAATDIPIGILQNAPASGEVAEVMVLGVSKCVANALIAVGKAVKAEFVGVADCGKADEADTDKDWVAGLVVFASGAEDDLCSVLLSGPSSLSHA